MDLESISREYFSKLNALAEKIAADIENTQEAYQDLWHSLSKTEQHQAIDESIINPSAVIKYANLPIQMLKQNYNTYSWFTKSQLNLYSKIDVMGYPDSGIICRSDADQVSKETVCKDKELKTTSVNGSLHKSKNSISSTKTNDEKPKSQKGVLKPKTPPPPPPPKISAAPVMEDFPKESDDSPNDIPKTGFDFLDNW